MDTTSQKRPVNAQSGGFEEGAAVVYGIHGRAQVAEIIIKNVGSKNLSFYRIQIQKNSINGIKTPKKDSSILIPVNSARKNGLRGLMSTDEAERALAILNGRDYYYSLQSHFHIMVPQLEAAATTEGGLGLAKVVSYLYTLKNRQVVASSEVSKTYDLYSKVLFRELAEVLNTTIKDIEDRTTKGLKSKLLADH
jgi:RNA polymerase-interacting CarD/CdnL/TRCF family regulator